MTRWLAKVSAAILLSLGGCAWAQLLPPTVAISPAVQASRATQEQQGGRTPARRRASRTPQRGDAPRLPNLRTFDPEDVHVVGSRAAGDLRLKFGTTIWNAGAGPLETRGAKNPETEALEVYQFFRTVGGGMTRGPRVGTFNYSHRHGHLHLAAFARYELWSLDEAGQPRERVALNDKVGFCLMDISSVDTSLPNAAQAPLYAGCRADVQGISVGYGDEYVAQLHEQDLDISGLPDGTYTLVTTANPEAALTESDYTDNTASVRLRLEGDAVDVQAMTSFMGPAAARASAGASRSPGLRAARTAGGVR